MVSSIDSEYQLISANKGQIKQYHIKHNSLFRFYGQIHKSDIKAMCFTNDCNFIFTSDLKGNMKQFTSSGANIKVYNRFSSKGILAISCSEDSNWLIIGDTQGNLKQFGVKKQELIKNFGTIWEYGEITSILISPNFKFVFVTNYNGNMVQLNLDHNDNDSSPMFESDREELPKNSIKSTERVDRQKKRDFGKICEPYVRETRLNGDYMTAFNLDIDENLKQISIFWNDENIAWGNITKRVSIHDQILDHYIKKPFTINRMKNTKTQSMNVTSYEQNNITYNSANPEISFNEKYELENKISKQFKDINWKLDQLTEFEGSGPTEGENIEIMKNDSCNQFLTNNTSDQDNANQYESQESTDAKNFQKAHDEVNDDNSEGKIVDFIGFSKKAYSHSDSTTAKTNLVDDVVKRIDVIEQKLDQVFKQNDQTETRVKNYEVKLLNIEVLLNNLMKMMIEDKKDRDYERETMQKQSHNDYEKLKAMIYIKNQIDDEKDCLASVKKKLEMQSNLKEDKSIDINIDSNTYRKPSNTPKKMERPPQYPVNNPQPHVDCLVENISNDIISEKESEEDKEDETSMERENCQSPKLIKTNEVDQPDQRDQAEQNDQHIFSSNRGILQAQMVEDIYENRVTDEVKASKNQIKKLNQNKVDDSSNKQIAIAKSGKDTRRKPSPRSFDYNQNYKASDKPPIFLQPNQKSGTPKRENKEKLPLWKDNISNDLLKELMKTDKNSQNRKKLRKRSSSRSKDCKDDNKSYDIVHELYRIKKERKSNQNSSRNNSARKKNSVDIQNELKEQQETERKCDEDIQREIILELQKEKDSELNMKNTEREIDKLEKKFHDKLNQESSKKKELEQQLNWEREKLEQQKFEIEKAQLRRQQKPQISQETNEKSDNDTEILTEALKTTSPKVFTTEKYYQEDENQMQQQHQQSVSPERREISDQKKRKNILGNWEVVGDYIDKDVQLSINETSQELLNDDTLSNKRKSNSEIAEEALVNPNTDTFSITTNFKQASQPIQNLRNSTKGKETSQGEIIYTNDSYGIFKSPRGNDSCQIYAVERINPITPDPFRYDSRGQSNESIERQVNPQANLYKKTQTEELLERLEREQSEKKYSTARQHDYSIKPVQPKVRENVPVELNCQITDMFNRGPSSKLQGDSRRDDSGEFQGKGSQGSTGRQKLLPEIQMEKEAQLNEMKMIKNKLDELEDENYKMFRMEMKKQREVHFED